MAGEWIKWTKGLTRKPEVVWMSEILEIPRQEVAGRLMEVWEWADDVTEDGDVPSVTKTFADEVSGITGFAEAMQKVGWLRDMKSGNKAGIVFPKFERHNGKSGKRRALTAKRNSSYRQKTRDASVTQETSLEKRREDPVDPRRPRSDMDLSQRDGALKDLLTEADIDEVIQLANSILPKMVKYKGASLPDSHRRMVWNGAACRVVGYITEAEFSDCVESSQKASDRAPYFRGCISRKLASHGLDYDEIARALPEMARNVRETAG